MSEQREAEPAPTVVDRARWGDAGAWRELYDAHAGRLLLWLRQTPTGDAGIDAEDLAMEAWTLAASRIADFGGDDDHFAAWLFTVARNHLLNTRKRSARRATHPTDTLPETTMVMPTATPEVEYADQVRAALASLPRREGEVIACVDVVDLDIATTARILGISPAAARMARRRGLAKLRRSGWPV